MDRIEPENALNLDLSQQVAFVSFVRKLPEKLPSTVRFFNRNDYYTLHGEDCNVAHSFTANVIKYMGEEPKLSYIVLKPTQFESLIRELLLIRQYRVEVFTKASNAKQNEWALEYKGSPGNLSNFEDILFDVSGIVVSNCVMAINILSNKIFAIGLIDVSESKFSVLEMKDNECFTELEALIAQKNPKECIISEGHSDELVSLKNLLERNDVLVAKMKKTDFKLDNLDQDLNRLVYFQDDQTRNVKIFPETKLDGAMGALLALVKFLNLTGDEKNFNQYKFENFNTSGYVRLDNAAIHALNVLPTSGSNPGDNFNLQPTEISKSFDLFGLLDHTSTNQGKRLLSQWIRQPLKDRNLLNERLDIVECFVRETEVRNMLSKDCLGCFSDLVKLVNKISSKKASLEDCYRIYTNIVCLPKLLHCLRQCRNTCVDSVLVDPIDDILSSAVKFREMIEEILDMEYVDRGEFLVKKDFHEELQELHGRKCILEEKMQTLLRRAVNELGFDQNKIKLECNDMHGYFFRVTLKEEPALRSNKEYKILDAIKGGVRFTNDKLSEYNKEYIDIKNAYEAQQKAIVCEMLDVAVGYSEILRNLNVCIAKVDVLVSFALAAISFRISYVRPKLHEAGSGILKLKDLRHPCLEQQDHVSFIPNDVEFDKDGKTFHIITGPNMCGKSTYIRSVGICVLMAHIGSFVPCSEADITLVDNILVRVGAEDCQLKGLSTFMLEMIETSTIVKSATSNSLVIIDELGRGTSTFDGCGIAYAIAEYLAKEVKCFSLFATHFHEITYLPEQISSVKNSHVTALIADETITPLFKVQEGPCDNSYGIHCAKMVGFPEDVLEWAVQHQKELEHYEGMKSIETLGHSEKKKVMDEGDKLMNNVLVEVENLDNNLSHEQLQEKLAVIKSDLIGKGNLFVNGLLC